jgi:hypothetical protein
MRERMSRELAEAVEILATERSVLLGLEDLPGSDVSTLDWLAYIARRRGRLGYWGWRHTGRYRSSGDTATAHRPAVQGRGCGAFGAEIRVAIEGEAHASHRRGRSVSPVSEITRR